MKPLILLLTALLVIAPAIAQEGEKTKGWFLLEIHPMPDLAVIVDEEFYVFEDPYLAEYTKTQAKILNSSVILDRAFERVKDQVALEKLDKELIQLISHRIIDSEHTITQSYNGLSADDAATLSKAIIGNLPRLHSQAMAGSPHAAVGHPPRPAQSEKPGTG